MRSADSLMASVRCQFSQNIHDFSQEKILKLKRLTQHDKRKSSSVMWRISFPEKPSNEHTTTKTIGTEDQRFDTPEKPSNEHTTTKTIGTEDQRFDREQRRPAQHAQR